MIQVTVGTSVALLAPAGNRDWLHIYNNGSATIYIQYDGQDDGVATYASPPVIGGAVTGSTLTTANGWPIPAGTWYNLDNDGARNLFNKNVYAVSGSANQDVRLSGV